MELRHAYSTYKRRRSQSLQTGGFGAKILGGVEALIQNVGLGIVPRHIFLNFTLKSANSSATEDNRPFHFIWYDYTSSYNSDLETCGVEPQTQWLRRCLKHVHRTGPHYRPRAKSFFLFSAAYTFTKTRRLCKTASTQHIIILLATRIVQRCTASVMEIRLTLL